MIKQSEKDHPVASAVGKAIGGLAPVATAVALAPNTLLGQLFAFAGTGAIQQAGLEKTQASLMDKEESNKRIVKTTLKSAAYAPLWFYTQALTLGGPITSILTRAGARGAGAAGIEKAGGASNQEAVMSGLMTGALSGLFELTPYAIDKVNTTIKNKGLDSMAETIVKNDESIRNAIVENYTQKYGQAPSEEELTKMVRAGLTIEVVKNNISTPQIVLAAEKLKKSFEPITPEVMRTGESGQVLIPFSEGDIVRVGSTIGKVSKIVGDNAIIVSTLGKEFATALKNVEPTGLKPQEVPAEHLTKVPEQKKEYVKELFKIENPNVVEEFINNDPDYKAAIERNKQLGTKTFTESDVPDQWPDFYAPYLKKAIKPNVPPATGQPEVIIWMGLPGSGKTQMFKSMGLDKTHIQIDPDDAKFYIPETAQDPSLADYVHKESAYMADELLLEKALEQKKNIIWPLVGKNPAKVREVIEQFRDAGYKVELNYNRLSTIESMKRSYKRYLEDKRLVSTEYIQGVGEGTLDKNYEALKGLADKFASWDVNTKFGEQAKPIDKGENDVAAIAGKIQAKGTGQGRAEGGVRAQGAGKGPAKENEEIAGSIFTGPAWRAQTGLIVKGRTAEEIVNFEADELGNEDIRTQAESLGLDLSTIPEKDVVWVTKDAQGAQKYGEEVEQVDLGYNPLIIATDGEGGYLVVKNITQKEAVKAQVSGVPKTIKEISEETNILEPNVRRILGVGAKDGTFTRLDKGVYILNRGGKDIAYIHTGDSVQVLPKLAEQGFKSDMVFLDIPYKTQAVIGGNRGIKYAYITPAQFQTVVKAVAQIVKDKDTPVLYMYSQAKSGLAEMKQYTDTILKYFKPIAKGEYTKLQKDGITRVRNMRGNIIEPEGILLLTQSGNFDKKNPNLNFKLIRPRGYQTGKPAAMMKELIELTTEKGEVVLDPFTGSGVTVVEAAKAGRVGVGIEKSEKVVKEVIMPRLEKELKGIAKEAPPKEIIGFEGKTEKEITDHIRETYAGYHKDIDIVNVKIHPRTNRKTGIGVHLKAEPEKQIYEPSDLDVIVEYKGDFTPGKVYDLLTADELKVEGIEIDVIPQKIGAEGIFPEGKTRKFITTVKEAEKTAPEVAEAVKSSYEPIINAETLKQAQDFVAAKLDEAIELVEGPSRTNTLTNAIGVVLIDKAQAEGRWSDAIRLVERLAEKNTEMGQAIQALAMYERLTPEGVLQYAERQVRRAREGIKQKERLTYFEKVAKTLKTQAEKDKLAEKLGIPHISEIVAQELRRMAEQIQTMPPGREKQIEEALLLKKISDQIPPGLGKKLAMLQTLAQLLNPKTFVRNILGNVGFQVAENVSDVFGTLLDIAASLHTGKRTVYMPNVAYQATGLIQGLKEGTQEALLGVSLKARPTETKFSLPQNGVFNKGVLGALEKTLRISLSATDRGFYQSAFNQSIRQQTQAAGVEEPTEEMIERANYIGLYRTFNDDNMISDFFVKLKHLLNLQKDFGLGDMVIKYPRTPANILARGIEYSPFGFIKTAFAVGRPLFKRGPFDQEEFVRSTSRAFTGSALLVGAGAILAALGIISGKRAKDRDVAAAREQVGIREYQLNTSALKRFIASGLDPDMARIQEDDTLITYDWFLPGSIGLALGANMVLNPKENLVDKTLNLGDQVLQASETLQQQPLVQGLKVLTSKQNLAEGISETLQGIPASFVPTILNQIRQLTDNVSRNTRDPNYFTEVYKKAALRIPGVSSTLPEKVDTLGRTKEMYQLGSNNPFNVLLNPAFVNKYKPDPVSKMVLDLWESTGQTIQFPRVAQAKIKLGSETREPIELTPGQYTEYQKYIGHKTDVLFTILANKPAFMRKSDDDKAKILQGYLTDINTAAKAELLGYRPKHVSHDVITIIKQIGRDSRQIKQNDDLGFRAEEDLGFTPEK